MSEANVRLYIMYHDSFTPGLRPLRRRFGRLARRMWWHRHGVDWRANR